MLRHNPIMTRQRQLRPAAHTRPMNPNHNRFPRPRDPIHHPMPRQTQLLQLRRRRPRLKQPNIRPRDKRIPLPTHNQRPLQRRIPLQQIHQPLKLPDHRFAQRIHPLARRIDCHNQHLVANFRANGLG